MSRYRELGVDVRKLGVEKFRDVIDNLYPSAFCVIQRDAANPEWGIVLHTDSAGSKPIQAYLMYKETGDASWFKGLAQDALAMNLNDILCVGAMPISFVDYVAFNTLSIDRVQMLSSLAGGFAESKDVLTREGLPLSFAGGETADLPDLLRTIDVSVTVYGRVQLRKVVSGAEIKAGDVIVGVRSGGGIRFESGVNSGIMSNGHTLARTALLSPNYPDKYPEISHPSRGRYTGKYRLDDQPNGWEYTIGQALLSPTRLFAPVASAVLKNVGKGIHGMIHNTGGGQTKCLRVGKNVHYVKDDMPDPDPIFKMIQSEAKIEWREMYQDFNMGVGFEFIVEDTEVDNVLSIIDKYGVGAKVIGHCVKGGENNTLTIHSMFGKYNYS